jgi:hypothetical protein
VRDNVLFYECFDGIQSGAIGFFVCLALKKWITPYMLKFENEVKARVKMFAGHSRQLLDAVCLNRISMGASYTLDLSKVANAVRRH